MINEDYENYNATQKLISDISSYRLYDETSPIDMGYYDKKSIVAKIEYLKKIVENNPKYEQARIHNVFQFLETEHNTLSQWFNDLLLLSYID